MTPQLVLSTLESALGRSVEVDPDLPLIESDLRVNSLTMFTLLAQLESRSGIEVPEPDLIRLSAASINEIAAWFSRRAGAGEPRYHAVLGADELEEGGTRAIVLEQRAIVIARHQDRFYAVENRCPHQGLELVGAQLRRGQLICRHHGARFDLGTGASTGPHTTCPLVMFPVRVVDGRVEVALPHSPTPLSPPAAPSR